MPTNAAPVVRRLEEMLPQVRTLLNRGHLGDVRALLGSLPADLEGLAHRADQDGDTAAAEVAWRLLTELDPAHAPWWHGRGLTARRAGNLRWARHFVARALAVDPDYGPARQTVEDLDRRAPPPPAALAEVVRRCVRLAADDAQRVLAADLRSRGTEEIAATILRKARRDGSW